MGRRKRRNRQRILRKYLWWHVRYVRTMLRFLWIANRFYLYRALESSQLGKRLITESVEATRMIESSHVFDCLFVGHWTGCHVEGTHTHTMTQENPFHKHMDLWVNDTKYNRLSIRHTCLLAYCMSGQFSEWWFRRCALLCFICVHLLS